MELAGTPENTRQTLRHEFRSIDPSRARIILVEAGPTILPSFPQKLRDAARKSLVRLGVEVREGTAVTMWTRTASCWARNELSPARYSGRLVSLFHLS